MGLKVKANIVYRSEAVKAAYQKAVDFCRQVQKRGATPYPEGVVPVRAPHPRGSVEVRGLVGEDHELETHSRSLPVLVGDEQQPVNTRDISLSVRGVDKEDTLYSLILHNYPDYPAELPVKTIGIQALSPTNKVWLRWTHIGEASPGEYGVMLVSGNILLHLANGARGVNDFFDVANSGDRVYPKGPFICGSQDVAENREDQLQLRLFLLPKREGAEILEIKARILASQFGNFSQLA